MNGFVVFFFLALVGGAVFVFLPRILRSPEEESRANLNEAQRMLGILRRAEMAYKRADKTQQYLDLFAKRGSGKMLYSGSWSQANLPEVEIRAGFDYECSAAESVCKAMEIARGVRTGSGIMIDIESGLYDCLGQYLPVTTEGFSGEEVTVGCRAAV